MYNKQLDALIAAADDGSFSKAARRLFISPAALIQQVNLLEAHLGITVFQRTPRGVALTSAGESIYRDAVEIRNLARDAVGRATRVQSQVTQLVRVGTSLQTKCRRLPAIWEAAMRRFPQIEMGIVPLDAPRITREHPLEELGKVFDLMEGLLLSTSYAGCGFTRLSDEPIVPALSARHPLAERPVLTMDDLAGQQVVLFRPGASEHFDALRDALEGCGACAVESVPFYDMDVFTSCEIEEKVLFTPAVWQDIHPSLVVHGFEQRFTVPYGLIHEPQPSGAVRALLEVAAEFADAE